MNFKTPKFIQRKGVVLSRENVPFDCALSFNAGISRYQGGYIMLFRNDYGFCKQDFDDFYAGISDNTTPKTNIGVATSSDGITWQVWKEPVFQLSDKEIHRVYDPRISDFGNGEYGVCFAVDTNGGVRGGVALTRDFKNFDVKSISAPENRNMVLFPEKINGEYLRLERPFLSGGKNHSVWLSRSPDLVHWGEYERILGCKEIPFANEKIGPGAPPIKTPQGWLTLIHSVESQKENFNAWSRDWNKCYYAGVMLLDLHNPAKVLALSGVPLLVPETQYELEGFRGGVIFPGGLVAEPDGTAKIYYGAADTVECLAEAKIDDLVDFCFTNNILKK